MRWTVDVCTRNVNKYVLTEFPFFDIEIEGNQYGPWKLGYMFGQEHKPFTNLDEAKAYAIKELHKVLSKINLDKIKDIDEFYDNRFVSVSYSDWCNNNGDGKYIHNHLWQQYHWIEGRYLNTTRTCHRYSIRYDRTWSEYQVRQHALKIVKRHIRRFLKQYNNQT